MIDDMASLKQAMEQMDADDATVAQAAKDRAGQILSHASLNFSKLGDLIEQNRLLLRPKIVASIKRMDQPAMLGDAAFRDTNASLRKEGQSFRQIAEALELRGGTASGYEPPVHRGLLTQFPDEPDAPEEQTGLPFILRVLLYPVRHPIRTLVVAVLAVMLVNGLREFAGTGRPIFRHSAADNASRLHADAAPTPPASIPSGSTADQPAPASPSAGPADQAAPPTAKSAPSTAESTPTPSVAVPPASTPSRTDARNSSSSTTNDRVRTARSRSLDEYVPERLRRNSRSAGPCRGGMGGCYWGGGQY